MTLHKYLLVVLIGCCAAMGTEASAGSSVKPEKTGTEILTATLAKLNILNPIADLDANLKNQDRRFIGLYGYTCTAPGTDDKDWQMVQSMKYGLRCLAGTGDVVESDEHLALIETARKYAVTYNVELLHRIRAGLI